MEIQETPKTIPDGPQLPKKFNVNKTVEETQPLADSVVNITVDETLKDREVSVLPSSTIVQQATSLNYQPQSGHLEDMIVELRAEMNEKLHDLRQDMLFTAEENKMKIILQTVRSNIPQNKMLEDIMINLDLLNQTDHFVTAFYNMAEENQRLKDEIAALKRNK